ncbi:MAG TPA: UDP-N-acetylmuramoyl-L-alanine--D-glutamate ligase [Tepidisphaeraceae bacterium]
MGVNLYGKRVTLLGLGRFGGGIAAARWLCGQGARVTVVDRDDAAKLAASVKQLDGLPIAFRLGQNEQRESDFTQADLVVASPAVKPSHPMLLAAEAGGVAVTTEIGLFVERCAVPVVGVTGTKGKSTTSAMIAHLLQGRRPCFFGGNIGKSLLGQIDEINHSGGLVVLELSSFMMHWLGKREWSPAVAVVTMLGQDHLDWHGSAEAYLDAKRNITRFQRPGARLVRRGDAMSRTFATPAGVEVREYPDSALPPFTLAVPGAHNAVNAQAAFLAVESPAFLTWNDAQDALRSFAGLPHRLQVVHESGGVQWVNDSIATIPEAAMIACDAFPAGTVIQIVGGSRKEGLSWEAMGAHLAARCKRVLTIGEIGPDVAQRCGGNAEHVDTLAAAVARAAALAGRGDTVLLSPGTASYDQFVNFEARGDAFTHLAREATNRL